WLQRYPRFPDAERARLSRAIFVWRADLLRVRSRAFDLLSHLPLDPGALLRPPAGRHPRKRSALRIDGLQRARPEDRDLHCVCGDGRPRRLPVRQLGRNRHPARVQSRPGGGSADLGHRRRARHFGGSDPGGDCAGLREAAARRTDLDRQFADSWRTADHRRAWDSARRGADVATRVVGRQPARAPPRRRCGRAPHAWCLGAGAPMNGVVETNELTMRFGGITAVDRVNFSLQERDLRCLIGPNGAGKSTFFKCLTGQYALRSENGRVIIRGTDVTGWNTHDIVRLGVGIKTQVPSVMNGLTVQENLWLSARRVHGWAGAGAAVEQISGELQLADQLRQLVGELSHGQRQMVEIGIVLIQHPWLVLLDEPAAGMTGNEVDRLIGVIQRINQTASVIVVDHDMEFVRMLGSRVTVFHQGSILLEGPAEKVLVDPAVREVYIGNRAA